MCLRASVQVLGLSYQSTLASDATLGVEGPRKEEVLSIADLGDSCAPIGYDPDSGQEVGVSDLQQSRGYLSHISVALSLSLSLLLSLEQEHVFNSDKPHGYVYKI